MKPILSKLKFLTNTVIIVAIVIIWEDKNILITYNDTKTDYRRDIHIMK